MKYYKFILVFLIITVLAIRLYLPTFVTHYVENQINKIPEYKVKIKTIDLHLWRGSYSINELTLWKITKNIPEPFVAADKINLAVQWKALLHGSLVAKIDIYGSKITFVDDPNDKNKQLSIDQQWIDIVKTLFPLNINEMTIYNGVIFFKSYKGRPPFETYIKHINFQIQNMQNSSHQNTTLSSSFKFYGNPMSGGYMVVDGKFDPFAKTPTFSLQGELKDLNVIEIAKLLKHYIAIDATDGHFSLYGKIIAANGLIKGEMKPFISHLEIGAPEKESPIEMVYNGLAAMVAKILENSDNKTVATKIKISGKIEDPNTSILSIIGYLIQHAFIQSLIPKIDQSIKLQDVIYHKKSDIIYKQ